MTKKNLKLIEEAHPELAGNPIIESMAEDLDKIQAIRNLSETEQGKVLIQYLQEEVSSNLSKLILTINIPEKEKDELIISIRENLKLLVMLTKASTDEKTIQEILDEQIKTIIG